ncbi:NACHT domain-containing protein, partial [Actinoplanes philippinensis]|uniref:NACHT domain-containing protein n=1 Tax=Actinoplanes philippinensis TaxID=35752 RepID=UPI0033D89C37
MRLIIITNLLAVALAITTNVATNALPDSWRSHLWLAWPLLAALVVASVVLAVGLHRTTKAATGSAPTSDRADYFRDALCRQVRRVWIDGVLHKNLYQQAFIELDIVPVTDPGGYPWDILVDRPGQVPTEQLRAGADLAAFLGEHRHLVVLGLPGAGKTTLLLDLTWRLLGEAADDRTKPVPVVFRLASWAERREPLVDWLVDELTGDWYGLPRDLAEQWIAEDRILPLLDGFDEVVPAHRAACARAIDEFRADHRLLPLAVSSRASEYRQVSGTGRAPVTVHVQPLTRDQLQAYLQRLGGQLDGVREALRADPALWELLQNPFLLSMAILAYQGSPPDEVAPGDSVDDRRQRLFEAFVTRALQRKARVAATLAPNSMVLWLSYLARALGQRFEQIFYADRVNASWLPTRLMRWTADLVPEIPGAVLLGLAFGLVTAPIAGQAPGWTLGVCVALLPWAAGGRRGAEPRQHMATTMHLTIQRRMWTTVIMATGLPLAVVGFGDSIRYYGNPLSYFLRDSIGAAAAIIAMTVFLLADAFVAPPSRGTVPEGRSGPRARWNSVGLSVLGGLLVIASLSLRLADGKAVAVGALLSSAAAYAAVGRMLVTYWTVRLLLAFAGLLPLRLTRVLGLAEAAMIVNRVGSGYIYHHRLLLEYFAGLELYGISSRYTHGLVPRIDLRPRALLALASTTSSLPDAAGALAIAVPQVSAAESAPVALG